MNTQVLVFYAPLPSEDNFCNQSLLNDFQDKAAIQGFESTLLKDMISEYSPFVEDKYDLVYYYTGDISQYKDKFKYHINSFIEALPNRRSALFYIHSLLSLKYESVIIIDGAHIEIRKNTIINCFNELQRGKDVVIAPTDDGDFCLLGTKSFYDLYTNINNWNSPSHLFDSIMDFSRKVGFDVYSVELQNKRDSKNDIIELYKKITQNNHLKLDYYYLNKINKYLKINKQKLWS